MFHTMSLNRNILLILGIAFFGFCITKAMQVFFSPSNVDIRKTILCYLLIYGGGVSAFEIYKGRNASNYGISISSAIGATLGGVAGYYFGYQICILVNILDSESLIESSSISLALAWTSAEIGRQTGSFLGNVLLPI